MFADVQRMMKALSDAGFAATYRAVKMAWEQHSADHCAGWLGVPAGAVGDKMIVDLLLDGTDEDDVTLNGRENGPFLVDANTGEKVKR